ncbi:hypothetical protein LC608_16940 [Nostoc sp. XA010]|uniref:hypothetical protein n=1 Tax=Nostoc sp. XA010 TaxID=2780407 RepID=UPI001E43A29D|nr:hypothetical protein [Nostoc sp. XA010]MCC5658642.1 hypothetical protein [Nostoc sp. XA010]
MTLDRIDWAAVGRVLFKVLVTVPAEILAGAISNATYEAVEGIKASFKYLSDQIMGFVDSVNPIKNAKKALGITEGSSQDQVINKVANYGIKQAVGTIPGIGGAIKSSLDTYDTFSGGNKGATSPLPEIKGNNGAKQISYNPSFTIAPQAGTDAEGLVALIRNTINNDWAEFKANSLA